MAFAETVVDRIIVRGIAPVDITLAGTVNVGDPLMYSSGWKLSASSGSDATLLVALDKGVSGQVIKAAPIAVIQCTNTAPNVGTVGEIVSVDDNGAYESAASNTQDVGFVTSIGSDSLSTTICVIAPAVVIDTARS
jgi:hypothetical protein